MSCRHAQRLTLITSTLPQCHYGAPHALHSLASLIIARHPFPKTVFKEKKLSEPVEVRLLTGAKVMVRPKSKVKAFLVSEENSVRFT